MKIYSWNVAGIRACEKKGLYEWYSKELADIYCFQETKALPEQLSDQLVNPSKHTALYAPAVKKGYSGVSTWVKNGINHSHTIGLGIEEFDSEGRTLITEFDDFILFNCYFPNGQRDHARVPYKMSYCEAIEKKALSLHKKTKKEIIITGDYNTAHHPIDLANPKTNTKSTGFLLVEREWMDHFQEIGFIDLFRQFTPEENGHYTWWTYRSNCRERNIGWRIDYFWSTSKIAKKVKSCKHHIETLGSDHCPISIELK
ncbi:exodeoxyribonuclease III [Halobacteriovorax sp. JY17]|uniref:exodeoxyribonuclease III n=1 Tax=Halobacteriovorax sp. JY17 TaxID=2014617 RepID=UPI000C4C0FBA|nr:exodeoxyribonuclease III [Halobacteriovorax sp. JY17]PIK13673.1 MAG: exodeoxyribonuclease III [Halobacteriovorax sp. JY17]